MGCKVDTETPASRKQAGRKMDLVARGTINSRDRLIVESLKGRDEVSTKFLRELDVTLFQDLHLIASHRLEEQYHAQFRKSSLTWVALWPCQGRRRAGTVVDLGASGPPSTGICCWKTYGCANPNFLFLG